MGWKRKRKIASSLALLHLGCYCDRISMGVAGPGEEGGRRTSRVVRGSLTGSPSTLLSAGLSAFSMNPMTTRGSARPTRLMHGVHGAKSGLYHHHELLQRQPEKNLMLLQRRHTSSSSSSRRIDSCGRGVQALQMGIRGLTGYVNKNLRGAAPVEEIREGDTLAIDGSGWMFEILEGQRVDHGGDYDLLHEATLREVSKLRKAGVTLKVFLDGRRRKMKAVTRERRRESAAESLARLYGYTLDGGGVIGGRGAKGPDRSVASFPAPKMAARQFAASLMSAGVEVIECPGEADQEVARASADDPTGRTFSLGSDSDFFLFERCRYVRFDSLKMSSEGRLEARVWTRARLAELCGITEEQVVEWALLMGNDYTEGMLLGELGEARRVNGRPEKTLEWVRARGRDFRLIPRTAAAALLSPENGEYCDGDDGDDGYGVGNASDAEGKLLQGLFSRVTGSRAPRRRLPAGTQLLLDVGGMGDDEMFEEEEEEMMVESEGQEDGEQDEGGFAAGFDAETVRREKGDQEEERAAELALEFSRALYGLLPLDRFPDDEEIDTDDVDEFVAKEETLPGVDVDAPGGVRGGGLAEFGSSSISSGAANRRTRRFIERKSRRRKGSSDDGGFGGGGSGGGGGFVGDAGTKRRRQEAPKKRAPTELEIHEAALQTQLLRRPFGDVALEALRRTLEQVEDVEGGGKVWSSTRGGVGGVGGAEAFGEDERQELYVEAGARRTALWSVALGIRKDLPDSLRVKWPDVLLAIRYQENLLEAYGSRGLDRAEVFPVVSGDEVSPSSDEIYGDDGSIRDEISGEGARVLQVVMPLEHFHGPTFHALLHDYRATNRRGLDEEGEAVGEGGVYAKDKGGVWIGNRSSDEPSVAALDDSSSITAIRTSTKTSDAEATTNPSSSIGESSDRDITPSLPIDAHREKILEHIRNNRVTVIHGETGSGKSSRIPMMIVEDALERASGGAEGVPRPRMFVSQPRRAATRALAQRVREESERTGLKFGVAMRLGHGVREGPPKAEVTFATTGYIVRLIANSPGLLDSHTHLIIDEVHERSVDTDLLCFFAKRLLETHPTLRLIVMSATMSARLVSNYYGMADPPLFVGAKRFPIREVYVDDLADELGYRMVLRKACSSLVQATSTLDSSPNPQILTIQHSLAVQVARAVGSPGSAVLIFVPGMASILAIVELFELISSADVVYKVIPFHSELPKEEMMSAFAPAGEGVVKVVVATNSAESSITLPDVDSVICLGSCKQMMFDNRTQRCTLTPVWISKASTVQRAGRTGRVRPGTVYKLYSRRMGEELMSEHGDSEIKRLPLDSLVLELKNMLVDSPVIPVLESTLEPPDAASVQRSLESLYSMGFISSPDDDSVLTDTGRFASSLGVDLQLGRMVALGGRLGVLSEAVALAAVLSAASTPFRKANHMVHGDPDEYNRIVGRSFMSQTVFDRGLYSDSFAVLRLLREYLLRVKMGTVSRGNFCRLFHLSYPRMEQLAASADSITRRVMTLTGKPMQLVPRDPTADPDLANLLRLLLAWTFPKNVIKLRNTQRPTTIAGATPAAGGEPKDKSLPMELFLQGHAVNHKQLDALLPSVFPGMKDIRWQCSKAVYTYVYQTPSRAKFPPDAMASRLWHVAHVLLPAASLEQDQRQPSARKGKRGGKQRTRPTAKGASRGDEVDHESEEGGGERRTLGGVSTKGVKIFGSVHAGAAGAAAAAAKTVASSASMSAVVEVSRDGIDAVSPGEGASTRGGRGEREEIGRDENEAVPEGFDKDAASSDVVVGLVYTVTRKTNTMAWERWRDKEWDASSMQQPPIGEKRICLVVTERFATVNRQELPLWGVKGHDKIARHLVHREHVEGVGHVFVLDVQHTPVAMKRFRAFTGQRGRGVYAVTDAPMIQVEFCGDREPAVEMLPEVFGVETSFEGGRAGGASQVIRFAREDNHAGGCSSLVEDVPLGARLLAAMANGSRQRKLRIWSDPETRTQKVDVALSIPRNVWLPHDVSPAAAFPPSLSYLGNGNGDGVGGSGSDWKGRNGKSGSGKGAGTVFSSRKRKGFVFAPSFSVAASVVYQGNDRDLFAVASTIMHLPQSNAVSDGITLLPTGLSWLSRALLCAGAALGDLPEGHGLKKEQIDGAMKFAEEFWPAAPQETCEDIEYFRASLREIFEPEMGASIESEEKGEKARINGSQHHLQPQALSKELEDKRRDDGGVEGVQRRRSSAPTFAASSNRSGGRVERRATDDVPEGLAISPGAVVTSPPSRHPRAFAADSVSRALYGFDESFDSYRGSPLASLKVDEALWGEKNAAPTDMSREAAAAVGRAARNVSEAGAVSAVLPPNGPAETPGPKEMSPEIGRALMEWSDSLQASGRKMAALMAFQAVIMGVLSVHRRNVLVGCEEKVLIGGGAENVGDGGGAGGYVYGDVSRLQADIRAATGVDNTISRNAARAFGNTYAGFGKGFESDGVLSVLRGVPWLSVVDGDRLVWMPPGPVAAVLDAADPNDPTSWMVGIGDGVAAAGGGARRERRGSRDQPHPCLQQFEAYFAHRADIDFATALSKAGLSRSALLVVSRIVASAAVPEGPADVSVFPGGRDYHPQALRGEGSPPPTAALKEAGRRRDQVTGEPVLVHRFEELAGFLVGGTFGCLSPAGLPSVFDCVADGTPGLYREGDWRQRKQQQQQQEEEEEDPSMGDSLVKGRGRGGRALTLAEPRSPRGSVDIEPGAGTSPMLSSSPLSSSLNGSYSGTRAFGDWRRELMMAGAGAGTRPGDVAASVGIARAYSAPAACEGSGRTISMELDSNPSVAFSPRFEAARFLVDLLEFQPERGGNSAADGSKTAEGRGRYTYISDRTRQQQQKKQKPLLARGVEVRGGAALLVVAAIKRLQDASDELASGRMPPEDQRGITLDALRDELYELCGCQFDARTVLEGLQAAPGVMVKEDEGDGKKYFWAFDANIVQDLIVDAAGVEGSRREVAELRGFLARALNLTSPAMGEGDTSREIARQYAPPSRKKGLVSRSKQRRRVSATPPGTAPAARALPSVKRTGNSKKAKSMTGSSGARGSSGIPLPYLSSTSATAAAIAEAVVPDIDMAVSQKAVGARRAPTGAGGKGGVRGNSERTRGARKKKPLEKHGAERA